MDTSGTRPVEETVAGRRPRPPSAARRIGRAVALVLSVLAALLALGPASLLLVVAETRQGRLCGGFAAALLATLGCLAALGSFRPARPWPWWLGASIGAVAALGCGWAVIRGGSGVEPDRLHGLVSRRFAGRPAPRLAPLVLVPEVDQVKLGVTLATRFVPWVGRARTIRETTMALYRSIEAEPSARGLAPVTQPGMAEILGVRPEGGHYFAYVPEAAPGERLGALVFLHGNGGNFQVMPWAWRGFAERHRFAVVCPTFGFGFWGEGGVEAVDAALSDALGRWPIDPGRVYLGGVSDGGVGVTRSARAHPDRYRGLIYVSPTMHQDELADPEFARAWQRRPILVLQGDRDWSVRKETVNPAVDLLRRQGSEVNYRVFPGEDHFLFFSRLDELAGVVAGWMSAPGDQAPTKAGDPR